MRQNRVILPCWAHKYFQSWNAVPEFKRIQIACVHTALISVLYIVLCSLPSDLLPDPSPKLCSRIFIL